MTKFNGQVPITVERKGEYLYYVLDAAPAFGSDMVHVFLTARRKISDGSSK